MPWPLILLSVLAVLGVLAAVVALPLIISRSLALPQLAIENTTVTDIEPAADIEPASPTTAQEPTTQTSAPTTQTTQPAPTTETTEPTSTQPALRLPVRDLLAGSHVSASNATTARGTDACGYTARYGSNQLTDGTPDTAWRVSGIGVGKTIVVNLPGKNFVAEVGLIPGYASQGACDNGDLFYLNRRITEVQWNIGGTKVTQLLNPDLARMQVMTINPPIEAEQVVMEIVSTTDHAGRNYTVVSEILLNGLDQ